MEYIYAALLLHKLGKPVNEENLTSVVKATGVTPDQVKVKALASALSEVNIIKLHRAALQANWKVAFDEDYSEVLASSLLWHFSPWTLKRLREQGKSAADI